ncbi:PRD domain-containing protein [Virgibacillus sp. 179-BFC.A HS]|uniref:PRD domain-containing protein n=1 Tax=Tigheibacillus jepli TaxID=3035914 RepID=A0ABU5CMR1_9BACI|nr:PRD domain-containing protein [Virgibacillus sp. 179-BFC.A HS]MDY0406733.1 PRD domain-containing protein [Virgibacillus sp. 179-BFC.A HS]
MNLIELKKRLQMLEEQHVITPKARHIALLSFEKLLHVLNVEDIYQAEMLFTHLPMALTRIEKGEKVESPVEEVLNEVRNSEHFSEAEKQVACIEKEWESSLPCEEKNFLYMHYTNVINLNIRGGE